MEVRERVKYILSITNDKQRINEWIDDKIGKPTHKMLNPDNLNQQQIDLYWQEVKQEINKLL
jgi:hypothetical protein